MWNRKQDEVAPPVRETPAPPPPVREAAREVRPSEPQRESALRGGIATVGKNLVVKGNVSGGEDLYVDGELEGSVELKDNNITIGPNGRVSANLHARDIVVLGRLKGNVRAVERLEIRKTGSLIGDIITARVVIEDGAYFKGSIDIQKGTAASAPAAAPSVQAAAAASGAASATAAPALAPAPISATTSAGPSSGFSLSGEPKKF
jgi:cytoskeletal protein CcmA (bactofilin family)